MNTEDISKSDDSPSIIHHLPSTITDLWLVRHGITEWNRQGRWQGWSDVPLAQEGNEQAQRLAARLEVEQFDAVYTSDLQRAVQTAAILRPQQQVQMEARLREMHYGSYEGMSTADIRAHPHFAEWQVDSWSRAPHGGSESLEQVALRMQSWAEALPPGRFLAVSHGATIRGLLTLLFDWNKAPLPHFALPFEHKLGHTAVSRLRRESGGWTLLGFNEEW